MQRRRNIADEIVTNIEQQRQQPLTDEERAEVALWGRGRNLVGVIGSAGWDEITEMWATYREKAFDDLVRTDPAKTEDVLANHAVAYAVDRLISVFLGDVQEAVEASKTTPAAMRQALMRASDVPPESF